MALLAVLVGALLRAWLLTHVPRFADEAVVGMMGRQVDAGHFTAFYWGQHYGGVEPLVVALVFAVAGSGPLQVGVTPALLAAVAAVLVALTLRQVTGNRLLGALGGALVWVWPYAAVWNSVRELGFRGVTLCCGIVMVLCAVRLARSSAGLPTATTLGLAAGVGWWASPEIGYFVAPVLVALVARRRWLVTRSRQPGRWPVPPLLAMAAGAVVGALPWIVANLGDGFASLSSTTPGAPHYLDRLGTFFTQVAPTQLGLRMVEGGAWAGGGLGVAASIGALALITAALVFAVARATGGSGGVPLLALGAAVAAFPFLYAAFPSSGYWLDGRYGVYFPPLVVLLLFGTLGSLRPVGTPGVRSILVLGLAGVAVAGGAALTLAGARHSSDIPVLQPSAFFSGWGDPNRPIAQVASRMAAAGITHAYGSYWIAYDLDLDGPPALAVSPGPTEDQRAPGLAAAVGTSARPAWLFYAPGQEARATALFTNPEPGAAGYSESAFLALLGSQHIGARVVPLGVLDAVVPDRAPTLP